MKIYAIYIITFFTFFLQLNALSIKGIVLDSANKKAISGATVLLINVQSEEKNGYS